MKPDFTNIKNIIFDLGNVLLNLDIDASVRAFQKLGMSADVVDKKYAYSDPVFYALEVGNISPEVFRNQVRKILNNNAATDQQIDDAWFAMIRDIPGKRVKTVQKLGEKYNVYLFSNTNRIHIERLHARFYGDFGFEFHSLFVKDFYSFEIHDRKPEVSSYEKVIIQAGINPEETLFVDDIEANILSAQKAGLKTFWLREEMEMAELF
jgi:putative hydrolase of the HAD superfamily